MSRPKFPAGCILPSSCISAIRQEQEFYDQDPEQYERIQREREEQRLQEQRQLEFERDQHGR